MTAPGAAVASKARRIRLAVFDVDGVMTDGRLYLDDAGNETKAFHTLDGLGLRMLARSGVQIAILTGRRSRCVERRAAELRIDLLRQGVEDKRTGFLELLATTGVAGEAAAYMGDDLPDLPALRRSGLALTVPDAPEIVRRHADYVTNARGGRGAVREACELILQAQDALDACWQEYLA